MNKTVKIGGIPLGPGSPLVLIAGPCVIENHDMAYDIAGYLKDMAEELDIPFVFKASYDKANRTSIGAYRGPGIDEGLRILGRIKESLGISVLSDVHGIGEVEMASSVLDVLQIPAFLCRQTDLIVKAAETGKPVNVKKGQFLSPWDVANVLGKIAVTGNPNAFVTERGAAFGYNNLVVDFRGIRIIQQAGAPVIFDATHSVQLPGGAGKSSGGQREYAPVLARAAVAAGADGLFLEVHPDPDRSLCDGPNSLPLDSVRELLIQLKAIKQVVG